MGYTPIEYIWPTGVVVPRRDLARSVCTALKKSGGKPYDKDRSKTYIGAAPWDFSVEKFMALRDISENIQIIVHVFTDGRKGRLYGVMSVQEASRRWRDVGGMNEDVDL